MAKETMTRVQALNVALATMRATDVDFGDLAPAMEVLEHMVAQFEKPRAKAEKSRARLENEQAVAKLAAMVDTGACIDTAFIMANTPATSPQKCVAYMRLAEEMGVFSKSKYGKRTVWWRV